MVLYKITLYFSPNYALRVSLRLFGTGFLV